MNPDTLELDEYQLEELQRQMVDRMTRVNENKSTSGGAQYVRTGADIYKTGMSKYIPGQSKSIYTYTGQLEKFFLDKEIYQSHEKVHILKDRLTTEDCTLAQDWRENPEDYREGYKQFVHFLAVTLDSMTAERQLEEIRTLKQKPHEHVRKYLVTFQEAWNVYDSILRDEEHEQPRQQQFLDEFVRGCQKAEKRKISGKMRSKKIQTKAELVTYISNNLTTFAHIPSNREEDNPPIDYESVITMVKSAIRAEFHKVNNITEQKGDEISNNIGTNSQSSNSKFGRNLSDRNGTSTSSNNDNIQEQRQGNFSPQNNNRSGPPDNRDRHMNSAFGNSPNSTNKPGYDRDKVSPHPQQHRDVGPSHSTDGHRYNQNRHSPHSYRSDNRGYRDSRSPHTDRNDYGRRSASPHRGRYGNDNNGNQPYDSNRNYRGRSPSHESDRRSYGSGSSTYGRRDQYRSRTPDKTYQDRGRSSGRDGDGGPRYPPRSTSPYSNQGSRSEERSRSRGRSPSADRFGCYLCDIGTHRAVGCPHADAWTKETLLWNYFAAKERRGERVSPEDERYMREEFGIKSELCTNNPARNHKGGARLQGTGQYCKFCNSLDHPTAFCNVHCCLCNKANVGHGWRTCTTHVDARLDMDQNLAGYLDGVHKKWKGCPRPPMRF